MKSPMSDQANMDEKEFKRAAEVVEEILRRNVAGVFACLRTNDEIYRCWSKGVDWPIAMGLAHRLQCDCFQNVMGPNAASRCDIEQTVKAQMPLEADEDLSQVPLERLASELFRGKLVWVLSVRRRPWPAKGQPMEATMWNGPGLKCMGLAALLQQEMSILVAEMMDEQTGHDPLRPLERRSHEILSPLLARDTFDPVEAAGVYSYLSHEAHRLRERPPASTNMRRILEE